MAPGAKRAWVRLAGGRRRRVALGALAVLAALVACARAPVQRTDRVAFPHTHPAALAHLLADFSTHPHASQPWLVGKERGNYSEWSYRVTFECGARCAGEARVHAAVGGGRGAPRHGPAPRHTVRLELAACARLPLLPWPALCDEMEVEWRVYEAEGEGGCVVEESARAWCGVGRVASGACARDLRDLRRQHLQLVRLRAAAPR